ncbi:hypothetical protein ABK040_010332 [Willaertia magna]
MDQIEQFLTRIEDITNELELIHNDNNNNDSNNKVNEMIQQMLKEIVLFITNYLLPYISIPLQQYLIKYHHLPNIDLNNEFLITLLKSFELLFQVIKLFTNLKYQHVSYLFLIKNKNLFISNFLKTSENFYLEWIHLFQLKNCNHKNLIYLSEVFFNLFYESPLQLFENSKTLQKFYKIYLEKLKYFNQINEENNLIILDSIYFPKIRYHRNFISFFTVGYQKEWLINNITKNSNTCEEISFEERRMLDCLEKRNWFEYSFNNHCNVNIITVNNDNYLWKRIKIINNKQLKEYYSILFNYEEMDQNLNLNNNRMDCSEDSVNNQCQMNNNQQQTIHYIEEKKLNSFQIIKEEKNKYSIIHSNLYQSIPLINSTVMSDESFQ